MKLQYSLTHTVFYKNFDEKKMQFNLYCHLKDSGETV